MCNHPVSLGRVALLVLALCLLASSLRAGATEESRAIAQVTLDYQNAQIEDVIGAMAKLARRRYVFDESTRGTVSIASASPLTLEQSVEVFEFLLAQRGLGIVTGREGEGIIAPTVCATPRELPRDREIGSGDAVRIERETAECQRAARLHVDRIPGPPVRRSPNATSLNGETRDVRQGGTWSLRELVAWVAERFGKTVEYPERFEGRVKIADARDAFTLQAAQVVSLLESSLALHGFALREGPDGAWKVVATRPPPPAPPAPAPALEAVGAAATEPLETQRIPLQHLRAAEGAPGPRWLGPFLSPRGTAEVRENTLILQDTPASLARTRAVVQAFDTAPDDAEIQLLWQPAPDAPARADALRQVLGTRAAFFATPSGQRLFVRARAADHERIARAYQRLVDHTFATRPEETWWTALDRAQCRSARVDLDERAASLADEDTRIAFRFVDTPVNYVAAAVGSALEINLAWTSLLPGHVTFESEGEVSRAEAFRLFGAMLEEAGVALHEAPAGLLLLAHCDRSREPAPDLRGLLDSARDKNALRVLGIVREPAHRWRAIVAIGDVHQIVRIGDRIQNRKVRAIDREGITLEEGGREIRIAVSPPAAT